MSAWISDNRRQVRNWIAALLALCWIAGGVMAWLLFREAAVPDADMRTTTVGTILTVVAGIWVSWTFLDAIFRRMYGWRWKAMDLAKFDYGRHREPATPAQRPASNAETASRSLSRR